MGVRRQSQRRSRPRGPVPLRIVSYRAAGAAPDAGFDSRATDPNISSLSNLATRKRRSMLSVVPPLGRLCAEQTSCGLDRVTLKLPIPPSINAQYATVQGRRVLSAAGRAYKDLVAQQILVAFARFPHRDQLRTALHQHLLTLSIDFQFGAPMRRDLDGGLKITQDAVCEALGLNDNRIVELHLSKQPDPPLETPHITVTLRTVAPSIV